MTIACPQCHGDGTQTYEEDGRIVTDACYHCCATGWIDARLRRQDDLDTVAMHLALLQARDWQQAIDRNPDGEGFSFRAAEEGLRPHEMIDALAYRYSVAISERLLSLPTEQQDVLIVWAQVSR